MHSKLPKETIKLIWRLGGTAACATIAGSLLSNARNEEPKFSMPANKYEEEPHYKLNKILTHIGLKTAYYAHCDANTASPSSDIKNSSYFSFFSKPAIAPPSSIGFFTYAANNPIEDRYIQGKKEKSWLYGGVFDGHGGDQVADYASKKLIDIVLKNIESVPPSEYELLADKITDSFNEMEKEITDKLIRPNYHIGYVNLAHVGSCVLLALKHENHVVIANCGDCRAVMGSLATVPYTGTKCFATRLNHEHNCREESERKILLNEHPNENDIVRCKSSHACYVKGRLQLTRSLGDVYLKSAEFNGNPELGRAGGRHIPAPYTPPYVKHKPDVVGFKLNSEDKFVILGTDGLWDYVTDQEAVDIVHAGMRAKLSETIVAQTLVEKALEIAAEESGMTLEEMKKLSPGKQRRGRHDDTTVVVIYF